MRHSILQCRHLLTVAEPMLAGLGDDHRALEPLVGTKTAGWLVGHLAVTGDFGRKLCGRQPICPKEWRASFNPGSQPSRNPADYPSMASLCDAFRAVYVDLSEHASNVDRSVLDGENPYAPTRVPFPTVGEFVAYLLSGHLGYHLGQLHAWRAAAGLARQQPADTLVAR